jgi:uncharacterized protein YbjT (DUF2867 family)
MSNLETPATRNIVLVQGAEGDTGRHIVHSFRSDPQFLIRAGTKDLSDPGVDKLKQQVGVEICHLDLDSHNSVCEAVKNVHTVVIVPPYSEQVLDECNRLIDCAKIAGVKFFVLLSTVDGPDANAHYTKCHRALENKVKSTNINYAILRTDLFMDTTFLFKPDIKEGRLTMAIGTSCPIALTDLGDAVYNVIKKKHPASLQLELTGKEKVTPQDMTKYLSFALGRDIQFSPISLDTFKEHLIKLGLPKSKTDALMELYLWHHKGEGRTTNDFERIVGKPPLTFSEFAVKYKQELIA